MGPCTISYLICKEKGKVNLMKRNPWLRNEDGTVLVVALLILVFLTLIGITITATTEVEIQMKGHPWSAPSGWKRSRVWIPALITG
jgi:hypothetical protein